MTVVPQLLWQRDQQEGEDVLLKEKMGQAQDLNREQDQGRYKVGKTAGRG
jgi:hypothetical protein